MRKMALARATTMERMALADGKGKGDGKGKDGSGNDDGMVTTAWEGR